MSSGSGASDCSLSGSEDEQYALETFLESLETEEEPGGAAAASASSAGTPVGLAAEVWSILQRLSKSVLKDIAREAGGRKDLLRGGTKEQFALYIKQNGSVNVKRAEYGDKEYGEYLESLRDDLKIYHQLALGHQRRVNNLRRASFDRRRAEALKTTDRAHLERQIDQYIRSVPSSAHFTPPDCLHRAALPVMEQHLRLLDSAIDSAMKRGSASALGAEKIMAAVHDHRQSVGEQVAKAVTGDSNLKTSCLVHSRLLWGRISTLFVQRLGAGPDPRPEKVPPLEEEAKEALYYVGGWSIMASRRAMTAARSKSMVSLRPVAERVFKNMVTKMHVARSADLPCGACRAERDTFLAAGDAGLGRWGAHIGSVGEQPDLFQADMLAFHASVLSP